MGGKCEYFEDNSEQGLRLGGEANVDYVYPELTDNGLLYVFCSLMKERSEQFSATSGRALLRNNLSNSKGELSMEKP